jgi:hypothetical protein
MGPDDRQLSGYLLARATLGRTIDDEGADGNEKSLGVLPVT